MARESMRRRFERRYGREDRLADLACSVPWLVRDGDKATDPARFAEVLQSIPIVDAQKVADYIDDRREEKAWSWKELPCCRPPFPLLFIEHRPSHPWSLAYPRVGVMLAEVEPADTIAKVADVAQEDDAVRRDLARANVEVFSHRSKILDDLPMIRERATIAIDYGILGLIDRGRTDDRFRVVQFANGSIFLGKDGVPLRSPFGQFDPKLFPTSDLGELKHLMWRSLFPALITLGFLNCRNVTTKAIEPDAKLNRERQKAGLKPFLRYHTINIEPMKQVLRTEGDIDSVGLKRALHICRGHFATYADSFLGRKLDAPLTVWRPSHVRGSAKEGVVISDYKVNPPPPSPPPS
jgi:hypothetical protein